MRIKFDFPAGAADPVLVEVIRGEMVESLHHGAMATACAMATRVTTTKVAAPLRTAQSIARFAASGLPRTTATSRS